MLWLTNVNPTFNKGSLKKCSRCCRRYSEICANQVGFIEFRGNEWKLRFLGGDSVDRFQYTSTTELNCEP